MFLNINFVCIPVHHLPCSTTNVEVVVVCKQYWRVMNPIFYFYIMYVKLNL